MSKLTRSASFDDRKPPGFSFSKLTKRAQTFVGISATTRNIAEGITSPITFSDALYRRYFGMVGDATKVIPPLNPNRKISSADLALPMPLQPVCVGDKDTVVIVDVFSTACVLAYLAYQAGYKVICVLSGDLKELLEMKPEGYDYTFLETFVFDTEIPSELAISRLADDLNGLNMDIKAVIAGAETGVELADLLSEKLGVPTNGTALSEARRNKYVMGETIRSSGIRAVKQLKATNWGEIENWLQDWNPSPFKVIVKPMDSAGSDDVTLCQSISEVQRAFGNIMGKINSLGIVNNAVLVQEYLEGIEYIVDMVSRDGEHKCMAVWEYDRRAVNGGGFVCFGQRFLTIHDDEYHDGRVQALIEYQKKVITALGIRHGPTHGEVKWCRGEPVLVEVGARCEGGDGLWVSVAEECIGYDQVQATLAAYLQPEKFESLPDMPRSRRAYGSLKWLINYERGIYHGTQTLGIRELTSLESYRGHQIFFSPNKYVVPTQNCFTWAGCVKLTHSDPDILNQHCRRLEVLEQSSALFRIRRRAESEVEPVLGEMLTKGVVVVIDPFSTGAVLAAAFSSAGYAVIAAYSAKLEALATLQSLVPQGLQVSFAAVVGYEDNHCAMANTLIATAQAQCHQEILAVVAGTETGVELADHLSELMELRSNGIALSEARRNKYHMGETIRQAGIRAVRQLQASEWPVIEQFITQDWQPNPFEVIVKPLDSAGSDHVTLCHSMAEVQSAHASIVGQINGLGLRNRALLVQEYLSGVEYVVDFVSRDGEHKCVAVWEYDRRAVNGAGFVCFGQRLLTINDDEHGDGKI
jgi:biotin carboxylase